MKKFSINDKAIVIDDSRRIFEGIITQRVESLNEETVVILQTDSGSLCRFYEIQCFSSLEEAIAAKIDIVKAESELKIERLKDLMVKKESAPELDLNPEKVQEVEKMVTSINITTLNLEQRRIWHKYVAIIEEQLGLDRSEVQWDAHFFDDLGADSLDIVELGMALDDQFVIDLTVDEFSEETTRETATVGNMFVELLNSINRPCKETLGPLSSKDPF